MEFPDGKFKGMSLHDRLIHELTQLDIKNSKRKGYNPFALGIYFGAAEDVVDAKTFTDAFTPTRGTHAIARKIFGNLDVARGEWVFTDCE